MTNKCINILIGYNPIKNTITISQRSLGLGFAISIDGKNLEHPKNKKEDKNLLEAFTNHVTDHINYINEQIEKGKISFELPKKCPVAFTIKNQ